MLHNIIMYDIIPRLDQDTLKTLTITSRAASSEAKKFIKHMWMIDHNCYFETGMSVVYARNREEAVQEFVLPNNIPAATFDWDDYIRTVIGALIVPEEDKKNNWYKLWEKQKKSLKAHKFLQIHRDAMVNDLLRHPDFKISRLQLYHVY